MKTKLTGAVWEYGFIGLVLRLLLAMPAWANPIEMPEKSVVVENTFLICGALLVEVICVWWMLRRKRRPRFC